MPTTRALGLATLTPIATDRGWTSHWSVYLLPFLAALDLGLMVLAGTGVDLLRPRHLLIPGLVSLSIVGLSLAVGRIDLDVAPFETWLRARGFLIPQAHRANCTQTFLTLASVLNLRYVDAYPARFGANSRSRLLAAPEIENNRLAALLKARGYRFVFLPTAYAAQVSCTNRKLQALTETLQREAPVPPIILIQGDHGHGRMGHPVLPLTPWLPAELVEERLSPFAAYALPGLPPDSLRPGITSVNIMRLVLRHYFGADLPPLDDGSYWSSTQHPYHFTRVH